MQGGCSHSGVSGGAEGAEAERGHRPEPRQLSLALTDLFLTNPSFSKGCHSWWVSLYRLPLHCLYSHQS